MKKILIIFAFSSSAFIAVAQCEKEITYLSNRAQFLDSAGKVERSEQGKVVFKVSKTNVFLKYNDDNDGLQG